MRDVISVIFSCDRAMQLDAALRSLFLHAHNIDNFRIYILYKATNSQHEKQYQELIQEYSGRVSFMREQNFRQDLLLLLNPFEKMKFRNLVFWLLCTLGEIAAPLRSQFNRIWRRTIGTILITLSKLLLKTIPVDRVVLLLVDDNLFVRDFYFRHAIDTLMQKEKLLGFSLRLGRNTTYCYARGRNQVLPEFKNLSDRIALFDWTKSDGDFGYPLEVSSSIYRVHDFLPLIMGVSFDNPNMLEERIAYHARSFRSKNPLLACYQHSVAFCNPINMVQSVVPNRSGESMGYSADELSSRFEKGERIRVEDYTGFSPQACHQEVDLIFEKHEN